MIATDITLYQNAPGIGQEPFQTAVAIRESICPISMNQSVAAMLCVNMCWIIGRWKITGRLDGNWFRNR